MYKDAWLLTGWEDVNFGDKKAPVNASSEGYDSTTATTDGATPSRPAEETGASSVTSSIAEENTESNSTDENNNASEVADEWYGFLDGKTARQVQTLKEELAGHQKGIGLS